MYGKQQFFDWFCRNNHTFQYLCSTLSSYNFVIVVPSNFQLFSKFEKEVSVSALPMANKKKLLFYRTLFTSLFISKLRKRPFLLNQCKTYYKNLKLKKFECRNLLLNKTVLLKTAKLWKSLSRQWFNTVSRYLNLFIHFLIKYFFVEFLFCFCINFT